ncbi:hypothetical protein L207DRAFT_529969 [Hyaloscypha variabilis F]|jgi:hypothetical protein|uniref:Uncharacterized protein n=1 Tax=Hyaloscypha variabilis (strain UAMH 11265 / GT02V1 / F) TaxID=1149755 RepID=A0A2J6RNG6_HYAVF|nr:hypothetical protein L207DRAFT_529969 [Hyaloscypha variabilis F]
MEAGRCVWSRLGERGETRCQPAEQEQDLLKDEHPRAEARTMVGSKSGSTPGPEILCPASSARGGSRGQLEAARQSASKGSDWARAISRTEGHGVFVELFSRGASWSHADPWPTAPPPRCSACSDLRQGGRQDADRAGRLQKWAGALQRGSLARPLEVSPATATAALHQCLRGTMRTMGTTKGFGCRRPSSPSWPPCHANNSWSMLSAGQHAWR